VSERSSLVRGERLPPIDKPAVPGDRRPISPEEITMSATSIASIALAFVVAVALAAAGTVAGAESKIKDAAIPHAVALDFGNLPVVIAGVAAGEDIVFVGEPLDGRVVALSRFTGRQVGELPPPPSGFVLPFILHSFGEGRVAVLDAGGLPQPRPFVPANPSIYEYVYDFAPGRGFTAVLVRTVSFAAVPVGFSEDFVLLDDGRILLSDAVLGSIWIAQTDGTIIPGIVPKSFDAQDLIPTLAFCPSMPEITVKRLSFFVHGIDSAGSIAAGSARRHRVLLLSVRAWNLCVSARNSLRWPPAV